MTEAVRWQIRVLLIAVLLAVASCSPAVEPVDTADTDAGLTGEVVIVPAQSVDAETRAGRETVVTNAARIDWDSARRDLASRSRSLEDGAFQIESGPEAPPVPVLLPSGIVRSAGAARPSYRALDDGYFAKYPGVEYDLTVSGTNEWFAGGATGRDLANSDMTFTQTITGGQVALNRYGAAYLLEFECNRTAGVDANACIDEAEALDVATRLVITGSR